MDLSVGTIAIVFAEDFDGLPLGPNEDEGLPGDAVWTKTPPAGWAIDDSGMPGGGDPTANWVIIFCLVQLREMGVFLRLENFLEICL